MYSGSHFLAYDVLITRFQMRYELRSVLVVMIFDVLFLEDCVKWACVLMSVLISFEIETFSIVFWDIGVAKTIWHKI